MADREEDIDDEDADVVDLENEEHYDRHGRRITTAYVEAAADALERGDVEINETSIVYPRRNRNWRSSEPVAGNRQRRRRWTPFG